MKDMTAIQEPSAPAPIGDRLPCHLFLPDVEWIQPARRPPPWNAIGEAIQGHNKRRAVRVAPVPPVAVVNPPRRGRAGWRRVINWALSILVAAAWLTLPWFMW